METNEVIEKKKKLKNDIESLVAKFIEETKTYPSVNVEVNTQEIFVEDSKNPADFVTSVKANITLSL